MMLTCNWLGFRITRILIDYAQKLPGHCCGPSKFPSPHGEDQSYTRTLRYVGVVWFIFLHVLRFLPVEIYTTKLVVHW